MAEPSGTLQGHFVRLQSISSRITSGPEDEVENFHAVFYGLELSIKLFVFDFIHTSDQLEATFLVLAV